MESFFSGVSENINEEWSGLIQSETLVDLLNVRDSDRFCISDRK